MRRASAVLSAFLLGACGLAACGDSGSGPEGDAIPAALAGRWHVGADCLPACGFTLTPVSQPGDSVNLARLGQSIDIELTRGGVFRLYAGSVDEASVRAEGSLLIVRDAEGTVDTLDYVQADTTLRLAFRRIFTTTDFDGDGTLDPHRTTATFVRR